MEHHAPVHDTPPEPPPAWEPPPPPPPPPPHPPPGLHPPPAPHSPPGYHEPDAPPPSYDDATNPLLGGLPPTYTYGTWQERDDSSVASTELESSDDPGLAEYVGNFVVLSFFAAVIYYFWHMLNQPAGHPYPYPA